MIMFSKDKNKEKWENNGDVPLFQKHTLMWRPLSCEVLPEDAILIFYVNNKKNINRCKVLFIILAVYFQNIQVLSRSLMYCRWRHTHAAWKLIKTFQLLHQRLWYLWRMLGKWVLLRENICICKYADVYFVLSNSK